MKKICVVAIALLSVCNTSVYGEQAVIPDERTTVKVSNRDVNRFVCPGTMQDMIYSKEKRLTGNFSKSDAFVKFTIKQTGEKKEYATEDHELFLVCEGNVYTIVTQPTNMPSTTVRLTPPKDDSFKQNVAIFKNMPLEKQALHIIRQAYEDNYPSSYKVTAANQALNIKDGVAVRLAQYVDVEGVGLRLKRYDINSIALQDISVVETDFLRSDVSPSILAVAVIDHNLSPNESTKVFVVEKRRMENGGL